MQPIDCPFICADRAIEQIAPTQTPLLWIFTPKPPAKTGSRLYLDGRVSAVVGTHTHVQTSDERVLANGTGFITDLGMCGPPVNSVIGMDPDTVIPKFITAMPSKFEVGKGPVIVCGGVIVEIDTSTGKTKYVQRFLEELDDTIR